jgi:hypothetical protein
MPYRMHILCDSRLREAESSSLTHLAQIGENQSRRSAIADRVCNSGLRHARRSSLTLAPKERAMRHFTGGLSLLATMSLMALAAAAEPPDLGQISRKIAKQPSYTAKPLYGLYAFGPQAKTLVWVVVDKSDVAKAEYDVLYFDRNANGDLTEPGERIERGSRQGNFEIGEFKDPLTGDVHTELSISRRHEADGSMFLRMKWQGQHAMMGGYAEDAGPYTQFAATADEAPILWLDASGSFSFQRWIRDELPIGSQGDVRVFLGHQGRGKNTFCAVTDTFLPAGVAVRATLIYTDARGKEQQAVHELKERC